MGQGQSTQSVTGTSASTSVMDPLQQQYMTETVLPATANVAGLSYTPYGGSYAPDLSQYTTRAADIYGGMGGDTTQQLIDTTQALMSPYQQNVIDTSLAQMRRGQEQARTGLEKGIIGSGAFDSSRRGVAEGEFAASNLASENALISQLTQQGYDRASELALRRMQQQEAMQQAGAAGLMGVGSAQTQLDLTKAAGEYQDYLRGQQLPFQQLQALVGASGAFPGGIGTTTGETTGTTTDKYKPGLFDYLGVFAGAI